MTTLYFSGPIGFPLEPIRIWDWERKPLAILVSFAHLRQWRPTAPYFRHPRAMMLDSGAFTSFTVGQPVDHAALLAEASRPEWTEAICLDVIGDAEGSRRNADHALAALGPEVGRKLVPVFHLGEPWEYLEHYCANFQKVGLGGMVGAPLATVLKFAEQSFARAWPKKLHSFGRVEDDILMRFPFHSADSSTWAVAPRRFRNWMIKGRGKTSQKHLSVDASEMIHGMTNHMEAMWKREQALVARWSRELEKLG